MSNDISTLTRIRMSDLEIVKAAAQVARRTNQAQLAVIIEEWFASHSLGAAPAGVKANGNGSGDAA